ncbi:Ada metal-binding domain-containing protein [Serratia sp. Se-PFBMAAmG]|nr:Ada metal-binding domain-containing protein [Serratia sp. Se-PFBMAAmG]
MMKTSWTLLGRDGKPLESSTPGLLGGHRKNKIYGRLDCPAALRALAKGHYVSQRVFFADEETAIAAGYRPCGTCMKEKYREWKAKRDKGIRNNQMNIKPMR